MIQPAAAESPSHPSLTRFVFWLCGSAMLLFTRPLLAADPFVTPKPAELAMTSAPGFPGASAVVLYHEEVARDQTGFARTETALTRDQRGAVQQYTRIKVLTEAGTKYANVELDYAHGDEATSVEQIVGRTIHADGKIIPFTGKPYRKDLMREGTLKLQQLVFTLPDVEAGSILEYSFVTTFQYIALPPWWDIQGEIPVLLAHYEWRPSGIAYSSGGDHMNAVTWYPILPRGVQVEHKNTAYQGIFVSTRDADDNTYSVTLHDVPALPAEERMPPLSTIRYSVRFAYAAGTGDKFWSNAGESWSKYVDHFVSPGGDVRKATDAVTSGATGPEDKVRKIYAFVMGLENTTYTRNRSAAENKAAGRAEIRTANDILQLKRGDANELDLLFISMVKAAGFEAYAMRVPNRSREFFTSGWLSMSQLSEEIAVVNVEGKERFFDPGALYCSFGHLAWWHTVVQGLRQSPKGTLISQTPNEDPSANLTGRTANLQMDANGNVTGRVDLLYAGSSAVHWRQVARYSDEADLRRQIKAEVEAGMPSTLEIEISAIPNLPDYEQPLKVTAIAKGTLGSATGKRLLVPADLFVTRDAVSFPSAQRDLPVYFHHPESLQDAVRIAFPADLTVEAAPAATKLELPKRVAYDFTVTPAPTSFVTRRHYTSVNVIVPVAEYAGLRTFYSQLQARDQESVSLKAKQ